MWITNFSEADVAVVQARTKKIDENTPAKNGITAFLLEKEKGQIVPGIKLDKLGMRGSPTGELVFDNIRVSENSIMGELHKGVKVLMAGLD